MSVSPASNGGIRAVLWDFGGVFTTSPFEAFNRYEAERGIPKDFIRGVNATNPHDDAWAKMERSDVDLEEFGRLFEAETRAAGHAIHGGEILPLLAGDLRPEMVEALNRVRRRYKTACLTNNMRTGEGPAMMREPAKAAAIEAVMALFDAVFESSKVGIRKPEPGFYQVACEELGIAPDEAVFLDDLGINLKPAAALGMTTIKVTSAEQALADLEALLGLPLR